MRLPIPMTAIPRAEDYEEIVPKHDAQFTVDGTNPVEIESQGRRSGRGYWSRGDRYQHFVASGPGFVRRNDQSLKQAWTTTANQGKT